MKCLGSLQLSTQKGFFEDVTNHHKKARQKHQRGEANHSASVFFSRLPACHAKIFERRSLIPPSKSCVYDDSIFICNQKHFILVGLIVDFYSSPLTYVVLRYGRLKVWGRFCAAAAYCLSWGNCKKLLSPQKYRKQLPVTETYSKKYVIIKTGDASWRLIVFTGHTNQTAFTHSVLNQGQKYKVTGKVGRCWNWGSHFCWSTYCFSLWKPGRRWSWGG